MTTITAQETKAARFAELHGAEGAFIIPNPWDLGTARLLEGLGFDALATTSSGYAFSAGQRDGEGTREAKLAHVSTIAAVTSLPVSADLEDGFGEDPDTVAETIRAAARGGVVGGSIEDRPYDDGPARLYPFELAVERVEAAVEAARSLPFGFTLTARCESFLVGQPDLDETIRRLQAYQEAGADVLYAPGIATREQIRAVVTSVDRPVNVVMALTAETIPFAELETLGVKRVSLGSALARAALGAFLSAARELRERGMFEFARAAVPYETIDALLA